MRHAHGVYMLGLAPAPPCAAACASASAMVSNWSLAINGATIAGFCVCVLKQRARWNQHWMGNGNWWCCQHPCLLLPCIAIIMPHASVLLALQWTPAAIGQVAWCQYGLHATSVVRFHVTLCSINRKSFFSTISCISKWSGTTFQTNTRFVNRLHTIKTHKRCNEPNITALPPVKLEICLRKHTSNSWFSFFPAFLRIQESPKKKHTQSHFVNELHAFCPFFKAYHVGKHRRGLMHVSYCISSHNFTYNSHFCLCDSDSITSIFAAPEIEMAKKLLKVTSWTN